MPKQKKIKIKSSEPKKKFLDQSKEPEIEMKSSEMVIVEETIQGEILDEKKQYCAKCARQVFRPNYVCEYCKQY